MGTVTDINNSPVVGATVVLQGNEPGDTQSVTTSENGFFKLDDVPAGRPYELIVRSEGFSDWQSPPLALQPGQSRIIDVDNLQIKEVETTVTVTPESTDEIAAEEV
jgi:hypothetical protein